MIFDHATPFVRLRAGRKEDPYTPGHYTDDWDKPDELDLEGFISHEASNETQDLNRRELSEAATLTIADPTADVKLGDRIREPSGRLWEVQAIPANDVNPFTGWRPTLVVRLTRWQG